jgi:hypothetical protein
MLSPPNSNAPRIPSAASTSLVRLSPLAYEHFTLTGYQLILPELIRRSEYRPFKTLDAALAVGA